MAEEYREASRRVVHEVNNPLSIIQNYLSLLDMKLSGGRAGAVADASIGDDLSVLQEEVARVSRLVQALGLQPRYELLDLLDGRQPFDAVAGQTVDGIEPYEHF